MSGTYLYLSLSNAKTGEIAGVIDANSPNSIVTSDVVISVPTALLQGINWGNIGRTHYYKGSRLVAYPECPSDFHWFNFLTNQWEADTVLAWAKVRSDRELLLKSSDWMVTKAVELGEPMAAGWAAYRQALRDLTLQVDPNNIVWPTAPQ